MNYQKGRTLLAKDTSWINIHECFEVNEEGCGRKRNRGIDLY